MSILFENIIFGPIQSRRLGRSLGVNLLPTDRKICNFDCFYCECGWTTNLNQLDFTAYSAEHILHALEKRLAQIQDKKTPIDSITFSGNGEPTLHPNFLEIVKGTIDLQKKYASKAKTTVITNASTLSQKNIFKALQLVDNPFFKLDAGSEASFKKINRCKNDISFQTIVDHLINFNGKGIIQTMFVKGEVDGFFFDNTKDSDVLEWLDLIAQIKPSKVMLYSIDRETPAKNLQKIPILELNKIAQKVEKIGFRAQAFE